MAEIPFNFRGTLYDLATKSARQVFLDGNAWRSDVGVGGGPMPPGNGDGGKPPSIWDPVYPTPPIANVPGVPGYRPPGDHIWGPTDPFPTPPIYFPPQLPPSVPQPPPPGTVTGVPGNWPVQPIQPPPFAVFNYPGYGPVIVTPPASPPASGGGQPPGSNQPPGAWNPDTGIPHPQPV